MSSDGDSAAGGGGELRFQLHDWRWVCSALASPRFPPCHLPLVDTIIIDRGRPSLWLCLQSDGTVQQRPTSSASSQEIYNAFSAFSLGFPRNTARTVCAVHYAVGLPQVRGLLRGRAQGGVRGARLRSPLTTPLFSPPPPSLPLPRAALCAAAGHGRAGHQH